MSNTITIELCQEDRARLDKIIEGLGKLGHHPDCSKCVKDVAAVMDKACEAIDAQQKTEKPTDDVDEALRKVLNDQKPNPAKTALDAPKASDHPTLDPFPEAPTAANPAPEASVKEVTTAELQQLVIALCRAGKKPNVVEVLTTYGVQTVSAIPEDKRSDAYAKLKALEG